MGDFTDTVAEELVLEINAKAANTTARQLCYGDTEIVGRWLTIPLGSIFTSTRTSLRFYSDIPASGL